jgi:hypothetical protein
MNFEKTRNWEGRPSPLFALAVLPSLVDISLLEYKYKQVTSVHFLQNEADSSKT